MELESRDYFFSQAHPLALVVDPEFLLVALGAAGCSRTHAGESPLGPPSFSTLSSNPRMIGVPGNTRPFRLSTKYKLAPRLYAARRGAPRVIVCSCVCAGSVVRLPRRFPPIILIVISCNNSVAAPYCAHRGHKDTTNAKTRAYH